MSHSLLVYRLEDGEGRGAYSSRLIQPERHLYVTADRHPCLREEGLEFPSRRGQLNFGFRSLRQARSWWYHREHLSRWQERGLRLKCWYRQDVSILLETKTQIVFKRPWVTPLTLPCPDLFRLTQSQILEKMEEDDVNNRL